jgi:hypothetical protein
VALLNLGAGPASMVWLEPDRVHAGGKAQALADAADPDTLASALRDLPPGPTRWVVDDAWVPSVVLRDIVEVPAGAEARDAFFRWRFAQSLGLEAPHAVQAVALPEHAWVLAGVEERLREAWIQASTAAARPMRSLQPRWLRLYNRLAATREGPGMLLSLRPCGDGAFSGTLAAWGRHLALLRQWTDAAPAEDWVRERVLPSAAYLHREAKGPHELLVWGTGEWPDTGLPTRFLPPGIPSGEDA